MKKILLTLGAAVLLTACSTGNPTTDSSADNAEILALQAQVQQLQEQLDSPM